MSADDPEQHLEQQADELEHDIEHLDEEIDEARDLAAKARDQTAVEDVAGDWEDSEDSPATGDDPSGAVGDRSDSP